MGEVKTLTISLFLTFSVVKGVKKLKPGRIHLVHVSQVLPQTRISSAAAAQSFRIRPSIVRPSEATWFGLEMSFKLRVGNQTDRQSCEETKRTERAFPSFLSFCDL
jgi:hypothetical protein